MGLGEVESGLSVLWELLKDTKRFVQIYPSFIKLIVQVFLSNLLWEIVPFHDDVDNFLVETAAISSPTCLD